MNGREGHGAEISSQTRIRNGGTREVRIVEIPRTSYISTLLTTVEIRTDEERVRGVGTGKVLALVVRTV